MRLKISTVLLAAAAAWLCACAPVQPANTSNTNANANSNANSKPVAVAPTADSLLAMDKKATEAYIKGDSAYFQGFLGDKFVAYEGGQRMGKGDLVKMVADTKCDVKTWSLDDPQMHMIDADTYAVVYKSTMDGSCGGEKLPSPTRAVSVYTRSGDKWEGAFHGETLITDPKNAQKPSAPPAPSGKKDEEAKPAPANADAEAVIAAEKAGWEAWKARDAKKLEEMTSKNLAFVGLFGDHTATQADTVKMWTSGNCDIKSVSVADGAVTMLSPTVALLNFKGSADGTCDSMKIAPLWGSSVYVKDGANWKLAFGFESPA